MKVDLVVTRHPALVAYLKEIELADDHTRVIEHASAEDVEGKNVCGVLPYSLSSLCRSFTEVPLTLPQSLRGFELTLDQVRRFAGKPMTYRVKQCPFDIRAEGMSVEDAMELGCHSWQEILPERTGHAGYC